jgi:hypothetical protein
MTLNRLKSQFADAGCIKLYAKPLAENDNSKNQVYFGPDFEALNLFPTLAIVPKSGTKNPIFKAKMNFGWLQPNGTAEPAAGAQLILYPQYPEVRFSGFLKGCANAPSELMAGRISGRVLFLGVTADRRVIGFVVDSDSEVAAEFRALSLQPAAGVFIPLSLPRIIDGADSRTKLLAELRRIHQLGWIESKQLSSDGRLDPCNAPQCGGFTLEAELGIPKNSFSEPDYLGWEVKQHTVSNFARVEVGTITLMTPEPDGGFYREEGVEAFIRKYGYADKGGRPDRLNFGGVHKVDVRHATTNLTMTLMGFDTTKGVISDASGCIALVSDSGAVAASWGYGELLAHWARKHSRAAYVPSQCLKEPTRRYSYGDRVRLAERTDSLRLLRAMAKGHVYYDPGIKLENASTEKPTSKRRSQFRVSSKNIGLLYHSMELVTL